MLMKSIEIKFDSFISPFPVPQMTHMPVLKLPPSSRTGAGEKLAWFAADGPFKLKGRQASCVHFLKVGNGRGLTCVWLYGGTVIRWTQYIRDKSRAHLKAALERQQVRIAFREECTEEACCSVTRLVTDKDKSAVVLETLTLWCGLIGIWERANVSSTKWDTECLDSSSITYTDQRA